MVDLAGGHQLPPPGGVTDEVEVVSLVLPGDLYPVGVCPELGLFSSELVPCLVLVELGRFGIHPLDLLGLALSCLLLGEVLQHDLVRTVGTGLGWVLDIWVHALIHRHRDVQV